MALSGGTIALIVIVILIFSFLIIFGIVVLASPGMLSGDSRGVTVTNNRNSTSSIADFRPVTITKSDLKKICDDSSNSNCSVSCSDSSSESSQSCSSGPKPSKCVEVPCPLNKNCRSLESFDPGCKGDHSCEDVCCSIDCSSSDIFQPNQPCANNIDNSCSDVCDSLDLNTNEKDFYTAIDLKVVDFDDRGSEPDQIQDITNLGSLVIALRKNNNSQLIAKRVNQKGNKKDGRTCKIKSNLSLTRIIAFRGTLFAVSDGKLYQQDPTSIGKKSVFWFQLDNMPTGIIWITKTLDDKYLWIQNNDKGFLINCKIRVVDEIKIDSNVRRIFGRTVNTVADLNITTHVLNLVNCNKKFVNIGQAVFNFNNEIVFVRQRSSNTVTGIRIILFCPYFLLQ